MRNLTKKNALLLSLTLPRPATFKKVSLKSVTLSHFKLYVLWKKANRCRQKIYIFSKEFFI